MNAAIVYAFDKPPRYGTFAEPVAAEGEVTVAVKAAGLHHIVKGLASGKHYGSTGELPFIPGVDGVGRLEDGTRVYFGILHGPFGSFAERCVTARAMCLPVPETLDDPTIAAIINPAMSSWVALTKRTQFVVGDSVLILGATGVAGRLAVQIAKRLGAKRIVAVGRNVQALKECERLGADVAISLEQSREDLVSAFRREFARNKIDIVLDYLWGAPAETVLGAILQKGLQHAPTRIRYLEIGASAGPTISLPGAALRSSGLEMYGSGFGSVSIEKIFQSLAEFLKEAERKPFQIKVKTAPLREVESLWNASEPGVRAVFQP
jgi:NADPH:quinone reductase-like Zn-dependent oxidoreductase